MNKKVSVIIPTKDAYRELKRLLKSLDCISDKIEVIVLDDYSSDDTINLVQSRGYTTYVSVPKYYTVGKARNLGIKIAKYNIIAMLDADTEISPSWYNAILTSMESFDIVAGYSPSSKGNDLSRVSVYVDGQDITYPQCNIAYKKHVFDVVGYLREDMWCAEDCEFNYRCILKGYTICYNPLMKVIHYERSSVLGWIKQMVGRGYGRYELNKIHPELKHRHEHGLKLKRIIQLFFGACGYLKGSMGVIK